MPPQRATRATAPLVTVALATAALGASAATAADLENICCADLEARVADLEQAAARKGHRKTSVAVSGQINQALLAWDDGGERNAYVVGNKNDQSNFSVAGRVELADGLGAGYSLTVRLRDTLSNEVDQLRDDPGSGFQIWESFWYLESRRLGRLTLGQLSRVSNGTPENDLSETVSAGFAGVQELSGAFALRHRAGTLSALTLGSVIDDFNGETANVVRYDTPSLGGLVLSASWGEDDIWDIGARYEGEVRDLKIAAAVAYTVDRDENGIDGEPGNQPSRTVVGSLAVLDEATGLNGLVAAGVRSFDNAVTDADGIARVPEDARFLYAKLGWITRPMSLGPTALYAEWGRFVDFATAGTDPVEVDPATVAVRVVGSEAEVWGIGVVQHIEAAEMQLYLGYRRHDVGFDLRDGAGGPVADGGFERFETLVVGSRIAF